jgi:hypothetical protein
MKRCYDNYWKGKFQNYNHCGTSVKGLVKRYEKRREK